MPSVQQLYELWAGDSELREDLQRILQILGKLEPKVYVWTR